MNNFRALEILDYFRSEQIAYGCTPFLLEMYNEAIAELEALQPKSCESCKHWKVRNKLVRSNECFKWSGSVMTPRDFYCNRYEAKEQ